MKKRVNINVHLSNKVAYTLMAFLVLGIVAVGVYALTPGVAENPGHSMEGIAPPSGCLDGQLLQFIDSTSGWGCVDPASFSGDNLGNHVATGNLDMNGYNITGVNILEVEGIVQVDSTSGIWVGTRWVPNGVEITCSERFYVDAWYQANAYARVNNGEFQIRGDCVEGTNCRSNFCSGWSNTLNRNCGDHGWTTWSIRMNGATLILDPASSSRTGCTVSF